MLSPFPGEMGESRKHVIKINPSLPLFKVRDVEGYDLKTRILKVHFPILLWR